MIAAGFENVVEVVWKWPTNRWPKDRKMKELGESLGCQWVWLTKVGMWYQENVTRSLYGLSVALFTRGLGWTSEELEVFLVDVRKNMSDTKIHAWAPM